MTVLIVFATFVIALRAAVVSEPLALGVTTRVTCSELEMLESLQQ